MKTTEEITRAAETVRVTVGLAGRSVRVEALHEGKWWMLYATSLNGSADASAVLAFDGGVRVEVGAPAPAASDGAREEPAPPPARWWQTVGAWGTREGRDTAGVVLAAPEGAWVRYPNGAQQWMTAATLDGMTPIPAPPVAITSGEADAARRERDHYYSLLEASTRTANDLHALVGTLRASLASLEAERDSLRDALASLESNGARVDEDPIIADSAFEMLAEWWGILEAAVEGEVIPTHRGITTREAVEFLYGPLRRGDSKWDRFREAFDSLDGGGQGIPDPRRIGAALRRYRCRSAANGYRIAMKMDHGACRWTAEMGARP